MPYILILGANSDIAIAVAKLYAENGYNLYLAGRNTESLNEIKENLNQDFPDTNIETLKFDVLEFYNHKNIYNSLKEKPIGVICTIGYIGNPKKAQVDFLETKKIIDTNLTGIVSILNVIANDFEARKEGFIIALSSIAGERGRKSLIAYSSAKAGLTAYLSGLRNRLSKHKVQVITVKSNVVDSNIKNAIEIASTPEAIAQDIFDAQQQKKDVIFTKKRSKYLTLFIKHIPERFFKKMDF